MTDKDKTENIDEVDTVTNEVSEESDSEEKETAQAETPVNDVEKRIETAREEAKENYDRFLRVSAEFENYKKRSAREMDALRKFANESLVRELLPVADNLERAIDSSDNGENTKDSIVEGIDMTLKEILKVFEKNGVQQIESLEKPFDPSFHEAVMQEESEDHDENIVMREFQKGYMIHDRLLRPAMVVVAKAKQEITEKEN